MQMDLGSLFALGLFIAIEGLVLFYLKKDIEILKSNKQTFANSSPEERIELFLYSKKDEETLELEKKLFYVCPPSNPIIHARQLLP